ncbi:DUF402 domain-containing protein [Antrihabitans cavernicola]|uniref:DUF402 domain-containing protein n=1 Tax=Antrihabitans cavernicola TaxID=2495913 RepID=A0A5A7S4H0_9NOCA|nr:DUF402 domain-containing protein [Spelaeibacter cavernicola]KAA0021080.1 DUF402 domain-containing protein [Spelaeibacter cavernicola]
MTVHVHAPKVETFDVAAMTNTDPKGFVRQVEEYRLEPWGLYMARPSDHPTFHYLESWLLPSLGIRVSVFHYLPEFRRDQDFYVDIGEFTAGDTVWTSVDHYLDLVIRSGQDTELLDVDELLDARVAGLLDAKTAQGAIECAAAAIDGIAAHGYLLEGWLASQGVQLSWRTRTETA